MNRRTHCYVLIAAAFANRAVADPPPAWDFPAEAMAAKGERLPWPVEVVRGSSGAVGVFVYERGAGLTLRVSKDGKAPWKVLLLPNGPAGESIVEGDRVETLLANGDDKSVSLGTFDLAAAKDLSRVLLPGTLNGVPTFSRLAARGAERYALVATAGGDVFFSQTGDAGRKWRPLSLACRPASRGDSCCPPLLLAGDVPHVFFVTEGGAIAHHSADDEGATWKVLSPVPSPAGEHGRACTAAGAQEGKLFHLVVLTDKFHFLHAWSDDAGAHWSTWSLLASPMRDSLGEFDLASTFRLKSRGKIVVFSWTEKGEHEADPFFCRFLVSRNSGGRWENFNPSEGIRGSTGLGTVFVGEDGALTAAFAAAPGVTKGNRYVLVRKEIKGAAGVVEEEREWWGK